MIGLTKSQQRLFEFLVMRQASDCPSYDEMKDYMGLASKSGIHRLIEALEERGYIKRLPNRARAIQILKQEDPIVPRAATRELVKELQYRGYVVKLRKIERPAVSA